MASQQKLADSVRDIISQTHSNIEEKKMFGGLCFMVNDKMCVGVKEHRMMFRIDPNVHDKALEKEGCQPMIMKGKELKGYVFVDTDVLTRKKDLEYWVGLALDYNKMAPAPKMKTRRKRPPNLVNHFPPVPPVP